MEGTGRKQTRSKSFLSRKTSKKQPDDIHSRQKGPHGTRSASLDMHEKQDSGHPPFFNPFAMSIIPDPLNELPTWYHREVEVATASAVQFRLKYPIHNPAGPRWYRNHHLMPPTLDGRPPSVFSPSFPPMVSAPERGQDPSRMAGPSRTPSGSPLPTPSSSQIRIQEPLKPRSRKISQGSHNVVQIADGTDTWSPDGYHQSSYDQKTDPESPITPVSPSSASPNYFNNRPRRASLTHGPRHRTMAPSPLSQSTSAVHLHTLDPAQIQLPRKLSKRRKPFNGLFGNPGGDDLHSHEKALHRQSTFGPSMTSLPSIQPSQKSKRGSVLGRLVKRFSVMRKTGKSVGQNGRESRFVHVSSPEPSPVPMSTSPQPAEPRQRTSSRLSKSSEPVKRVPPPSIDTVQRDSAPSIHRRSSESLSVLEMPTSPGRLMVANPDDPSSEEHTPVEAPIPLPDPQAASPPPPSKDSLTLSDMPRTESPVQMESFASPRRRSMRLVDSSEHAPQPPSSPPLPELPPPTPSPALQGLYEASGIDSLPSSSSEDQAPLLATPTHPRNSIAHSVSPASTVVPLPRPEDIALARASTYVNPPTPYTAPTPLAASPIDADVKERQRDSGKRVDRSPTKSKEGASRSKSTRQTETFRLVRSPSGTIKQATELIMGMGEHWEVVESQPESPKKSKSKDREKEKTRPSEREQAVQREESRRRRDHSSSTEEGESRHKRQPSTNGREKPPSITSVRSTQTPIVPRRSVKKSSDGEESRPSKRVSAGLPPGAAPPVPQQQMRERHLSATAATTRPNSELHSAADWSSVRAKDAWEMERLWKARSMAYGPDGMPVVSTPATIGSDSRPSTFIGTELQRVSSIPSVTAVAEMQKASSLPPTNQMHGSSHTYVVVQTPYQGSEGHAVYNPFTSPSAQSMMLSPAQQFYRHPGYVSPDPHAHNPLPSPPRHSTYQPSPLPSALTNPLPEPPRLSTYQPAPLPPSLAGTRDSSIGHA